MVEVSCFYIYYEIEPVNFTFIKYEKFIQIILQDRRMVIAIEKLKNYKMLFQFYTLSLLTSQDIKKVSRIGNTYGVYTRQQWKDCFIFSDYKFSKFEKGFLKNPLLSQEPKRETSFKKQKKLFKVIDNYYGNKHITHPLNSINGYISSFILSSRIEKLIDEEAMKIIELVCED
jgi:hypothetical protein